MKKTSSAGSSRAGSGGTGTRSKPSSACSVTSKPSSASSGKSALDSSGLCWRNFRDGPPHIRVVCL